MNRRGFLSFLGIGAVAAPAIIEVAGSVEPTQWIPSQSPSVVNESYRAIIREMSDTSAFDAIHPTDMDINRYALHQWEAWARSYVQTSEVTLISKRGD